MHESYHIGQLGLMRKCLDGGRINIGACSLGAAWSALDKTRDYMFERKAFGQELANFQAMQFKIADMATNQSPVEKPPSVPPPNNHVPVNASATAGQT